MAKNSRYFGIGYLTLSINRLVNVASKMGAVSLHWMSKEMSTKFKNAGALEEVDELMSSFVK